MWSVCVCVVTDVRTEDREGALDMLIYAGPKGGFVNARHCVWEATHDVAAYALSQHTQLHTLTHYHTHSNTQTQKKHTGLTDEYAIPKAIAVV